MDEQFKVLGSEMRLVTSQFDENEESVQSLTARNKVLSKEIDSQRERIETLRSALKNAAESFGENDSRTLAWQRKLNDAQATLNKMEREVEQNTEAIDDLGDETKESGEQAEKAGNKFEGFGSTMKAVGAAVGVTMAAIGAAAFKLGSEVVESFGELEQNLGGSEAVFGEFADEIQKIGEEAYRQMGASQSDYLATANKMGALFQGAGLSQQRSLDLTTKAMQRAADMASVMGIDTSAAFEAVTGAAKGNYTMMDNLGVAMNATTLEAYAAAQGVKTAWKEMSNAEKAEIAMQYFFEQTSQYAGNFEREARDTVSGAIGMFEAAFDSFVAGLGNADADMGALTANLADSFSAVTENVAPVLENLALALPPVLTTLLSEIGGMLPELTESAIGIVKSLIAGISLSLPDILDAAMAICWELINGLTDPGTLQFFANAALGMIEQLVSDLGANLPYIVESALLMVITLAEGLADSAPELIPVIVDTVIMIANVLIENLDVLVQAGMQLMFGLLEGIFRALPSLLLGVGEVITNLITEVLSLLGIHSPSTVFADIGDNMAKGLDEGFLDTMKGVEDDMRKAIPTEFDTDVDINAMRTSGVNRTVEHSGTIRVEGVNDRGEMVDVVDIVIERIKEEDRT